MGKMRRRRRKNLVKRNIKQHTICPNTPQDV